MDMQKKHKIRKNGIARIVTERALSKFKALGYEEVLVEEKTKYNIDEMTKNDIINLLEEKGIEYNPRDRKQELFNQLEGCE